MENAALFRFFKSLNDFLPAANKNSVIKYQFKDGPSIKDAIEAIGVPHTETDTIVVNGIPVDFSYILKDVDEVEVFPLLTIADLTIHSLTPTLRSPVCFIADVNAGKLAKGLRMLGIDTRYHNDWNDMQMADIAEKENRVVLTRDVALLKHRKIKWGYWLRSQQVNRQLTEVIKRYQLQSSIKPFERCIECNGEIEPVKKEELLHHLPPKTIEYFNEFYQCRQCGKTYWKGSHYEHMLQKIERIIAEAK